MVAVAKTALKAREPKPGRAEEHAQPCDQRWTVQAEVVQQRFPARHRERMHSAIAQQLAGPSWFWRAAAHTAMTAEQELQCAVQACPMAVVQLRRTGDRGGQARQR